MNEKKKVVLARWVDQIAAKQRPTPARTGRSWHSVYADDDSAGTGDSDFARLRRSGEKWTVILMQPAFGGLHAAAYLRRLLIQREIPHYQIPWRAINAAAIVDSTIEVIDTSRHRGLFAFPDTVFRAETRARRTESWDSVLGRRTSGRGYRVAYFLSGLDRQEWSESYFLCELPPGAEPTTVAEAYESLKPEAVKEAERMGLKVRRQGDIFAIEAPTFEPTGYIQERVMLLDTNHMAEVATKQGGMLYARGKVRHTPAGRRADHRTLNLGKRWHLILKNTVPLAK